MARIAILSWTCTQNMPASGGSVYPLYYTIYYESPNTLICETKAGSQGTLFNGLAHIKEPKYTVYGTMYSSGVTVNSSNYVITWGSNVFPTWQYETLQSWAVDSIYYTQTYTITNKLNSGENTLLLWNSGLIPSSLTTQHYSCYGRTTVSAQSTGLGYDAVKFTFNKNFADNVPAPLRVDINPSENLKKDTTISFTISQPTGFNSIVATSKFAEVEYSYDQSTWTRCSYSVASLPNYIFSHTINVDKGKIQFRARNAIQLTSSSGIVYSGYVYTDIYHIGKQPYGYVSIDGAWFPLA